jgi:hypothetical protein
VSDFRIHSFVIKLWLESSVGATKRAVWRGRISHIPGNEYLYLKKLLATGQFALSQASEQRHCHRLTYAQVTVKDVIANPEDAQVSSVVPVDQVSFTSFDGS